MVYILRTAHGESRGYSGDIKAILDQAGFISVSHFTLFLAPYHITSVTLHGSRALVLPHPMALSLYPFHFHALVSEPLCLPLELPLFVSVP